MEIPGLDGVGGPSYIGTGCFHRREALLGRKYTEDYKFDWTMQKDALEVEGNVEDLQERAKKLASCTYELNSQWGKQVSFYLPSAYNPLKIEKWILRSTKVDATEISYKALFLS